jgi:hypothetical protein
MRHALGTISSDELELRLESRSGIRPLGSGTLALQFCARTRPRDRRYRSCASRDELLGTQYLRRVHARRPARGNEAGECCRGKKHDRYDREHHRIVWSRVVQERLDGAAEE